jgi:hypothetical protein
VNLICRDKLLPPVSHPITTIFRCCKMQTRHLTGPWRS